ncbi:MAG: hypothetical protein KDA79_24805, partial [Planctomycetaceae bacterium]|nr:hypothetical protein [Planctomycetaceae bacterium]
MTNHLSDEQLIELVQSKEAEDFTAEEVDQLRRRLAASDELRLTLFERLHLESRLHEVLGNVDVSIDDILSRAARMEQPAWRRTLWPLGLGFSLLLAVLGGMWLNGNIGPFQPAADPQQLVAGGEGLAPADDETNG